MCKPNRVLILVADERLAARIELIKEDETRVGEVLAIESVGGRQAQSRLIHACPSGICQASELPRESAFSRCRGYIGNPVLHGRGCANQEIKLDSVCASLVRKDYIDGLILAALIGITSENAQDRTCAVTGEDRRNQSTRSTGWRTCSEHLESNDISVCLSQANARSINDELHAVTCFVRRRLIKHECFCASRAILIQRNAQTALGAVIAAGLAGRCTLQYRNEAPRWLKRCRASCHCGASGTETYHAENCQ